MTAGMVSGFGWARLLGSTQLGSLAERLHAGRAYEKASAVPAAALKSGIAATRPRTRCTDGASITLSAVDPPYLFPSYTSTRLRAPLEPLFPLPVTLSERTGPTPTAAAQTPGSDLTRQHAGAPLGERIIVHGHVLDSSGAPVGSQLVEIWQANAAGRYAHERDDHPAPLDPNFTGAGRCVTDAAGAYRFVTIKPGAYPWRNHPNAWRPAHIHFSAFGRSFRSRLVTQMYFPGDPLLEVDPIVASIPDRSVARRLVSSLDLDASEPEWALAYRFDIVLPGAVAPG